MQLRNLKEASGTLFLDWSGSDEAGHLIMTAQVSWHSESFDLNRELAIRDLVARYRRLTELGAASSLKERKSENPMSAYQELVDIASKYQKYHPLVKNCKIVTSRQSPAIGTQGSKLTVDGLPGSQLATTRDTLLSPEDSTAPGSPSSSALPAKLPPRPPGMNTSDGAGFFGKLQKKF